MVERLVRDRNVVASWLVDSLPIINQRPSGGELTIIGVLVDQETTKGTHQFTNQEAHRHKLGDLGEQICETIKEPSWHFSC